MFNSCIDILEKSLICYQSDVQSEEVDNNAAPEGSSKNTKESKAAKKAERVRGIADYLSSLLHLDAPWGI